MRVICTGKELDAVFKDKNGEDLKLGDVFMMYGERHKLGKYQGKMQIFPACYPYSNDRDYAEYPHPYLYCLFDKLALEAEKL